MKRTLNPREKVLIVILAVLALVCVYYYAFSMPVSDQTDKYREDAAAVEDQLMQTEIMSARKRQMESELKEILEGGATDVRELPPYDNSRNVMEELSLILASAKSYEVSFTSVEIEDSTARRAMQLQFECDTYGSVRDILERIHDSQYRSLMQDLTLTYDDGNSSEISFSGSSGGSYRVSVNITYYEYC